MPNFDKRIEATWPDKDVEGWMVIQLECGHHDYRPKGDTNQVAHCGDCLLAHRVHVAKMAEINKKLEESQRAAVALADAVFEETYGSEENPHG